MLRTYVIRCTILLAITLTSFAQEPDPNEATQAASQAIPILEENCFKCHDARDKTKGGLSLSAHAGLLEGGNTSPAIDLANPAASLFLEMISYKDEDHEMPPDGKLPDTQIETLTEWIMLGAPWTEGTPQNENDPPTLMHGLEFGDKALWAFEPITFPPLPETSDPEWAANPIDAFVLARLDQARIDHAPQAEKSELIRRLFYDLIGLAPTTEQVAAFVHDDDPNAYEYVVDYLLTSKHYGEKWGRHWLDLVRYADSNGYERDSNKPFMWRYRDYVIKAFNEDKPYDQFVIEQLAGDELDAPDADARTATGFNLLGLWDDEPADPLLARYDNLDDIANTSAQVFLGLTMGCARCHGHKLDPIPQADYYRFLSFFEGINTENRQDSSLRFLGSPFEKRVKEYKSKNREKQSEIASLKLRELLLDFRDEFIKDMPEKAAEENITTPDLTDLTYRFNRGEWDALPDFTKIEPEGTGILPFGLFGLPRDVPEDNIGFVYEGMLRVPKTGDYTFYIDALDGIRMTINEKPIMNAEGLRGNKEQLGKKEYTTKLNKGLHPIQLACFIKGGPFRMRLEWSGPSVEKRHLTVRGDYRRYHETLQGLFEDFGNEVQGPKARAEFQRLRSRSRNERGRSNADDMAAMVSEDGPEAPESHILLRGNPHTQGKIVQPGFPEIFRTPDPALPSPYKNDNSSGRRRILAEWIASPSNPLTARVMANRIWQFHFGRGLVRSSNNFGAKGDRPTHPQLLDWLAADFIDGQWSMKRLHKTILMSNTYRMSSRPNPTNLAQDPINNLLWRFDIRRLTAEELRDSLLQVAGNLNTTMFGPGIYPVMPEEAAASSSTGTGKWGESSPEEAARRSVYVHARRSLRLPILASFDAPEGDISCPIRFATTQPTQALGMLNSTFVNEQAKLLADRVTKEVGDDPRSQVQRAIEIVVSRTAREEEIEQGLLYIQEMQSEPNFSTEKALERFCLLALNLNEFIYID